MYNAKEFGSRLKECREAAGLTQEQLAESLHISADYECKLENGKRNASVELSIQTAMLFSVSLDYLLLGKPLSGDNAQIVIRDVIKMLQQLERQL